MTGDELLAGSLDTLKELAAKHRGESLTEFARLVEARLNAWLVEKFPDANPMWIDQLLDVHVYLRGEGDKQRFNIDFERIAAGLADPWNPEHIRLPDVDEDAVRDTDPPPVGSALAGPSRIGNPRG